MRYSYTLVPLPPAPPPRLPQASPRPLLGLFPNDCAAFSLSWLVAKYHLFLSQEVQVNVCFFSPSAPLTSEGSLMIHVEPSGPNYEMKLRGTATEAERTRDG